MAAIGSIRKRSGLLIVLIGVALVLFLLGDLFSGGANLFNNQEVSLGTIAGQDVNQRDFELKVQETIDKQYGPEGANERVKTQVRERVWQQMVNERIIKKEFESLGISVSPDELLDQVQNTQQGSLLYQYFSDPNTGQIVEQFRNPQTGGLDAGKVLTFIQNIINSENAKDWLPMEAAIKEDVANRKYATLIGKGLFTTTPEADQLFDEKNTELSFSYVVKEFMSIPDEDIEVSDADLQSYYNEHKSEAMFQSEESTRDIKYVQFDLIPTEEDIAEINAELSDLIAPFAADSLDTAFILENAESNLEQMIRYFEPEALPFAIKDTVLNSEVGTVFGPYQEGPNMLISKLSKIRLSPDSVQASHILIRVEGGDTSKLNAARVKLDSLKAVAQARNNFGELAKEYSDDLGSGEKGGELDWFSRGQMVPEFEEACFSSEKGEMPIVETQYGVHLIYITDQTDDQESYLISSVDLPVEPSKYTSDAVYKESSVFSVEHNSQSKFEGAEGVTILTAEGLRISDDAVGQIGPGSKEILRWAYNEETELGEVSNPFELDDKIVVCVLTNVREKGTMSLEAATLFIRPEVIKEKKSAKFIEEFGTYSTLEEAAANAKKDIQRVSSARFDDSNISGGLGRETILLGSVSSLESGSVTKPIVGNRGVFVARLDGKNANNEERTLDNIKVINNNNYFSRADRSAADAVKKEVGVEDNRGRYY